MMGRPLDVRALQRPLKLRYREAPAEAVIRTTARCSMEDPGDPRACRLQAGPLGLTVEAHEGVGGPGRAPCSGDLLLGALAACLQITMQMVASAMGLALERAAVEVSGELDLRGTLGLDRDAPVGYRNVACELSASAPGATADQLARLAELTRRFCVVHATLGDPPEVRIRFEPGTPGADGRDRGATDGPPPDLPVV